MTPTLLPTDRLRWIGCRFRDPNGRTFEFEGGIYRAIYPGKVAHVRHLFESGLVAQFVERGWLIESEMTALEVPGYALVLRHRRAPFAFATGSHQWTRSLLLDAARVYIDFNLALAAHGLSLVDGHSGNFAQVDCCRPVWLDFGSIVPLTDPAAGLNALLKHFINPLKLLSRSAVAGRMARTMIREGGIADAELLGLAARPERILRLFLRAAPAIVERVRFARGGDLVQQRRRRLEIAREHLPARFPVISTKWTGYDKSGALPANYDGLGPRRAAVLAIMQRLRPRQVIDLACNAGFFSFMAARQGAEVFAVDFDEGAIEKLYELARGCGERLSVTSACADLTRPIAVKPQAELVLALALTHHIALTQNFPWSYIAENLAGYSSRALVVEYMPNGLCGVRRKLEPLPAWYTLDQFMEAFRRHFETVEVVPYPDEGGSPRTMVLCQGKKPSSA